MKTHFCALAVGSVVLCLFSPLADAAIFLVTSMNDAGPGSLRQAITEANAVPSADVIQFNIAPEQGQYIFLNSALPEITDTLTIDGTTQPGYTGEPFVFFYMLSYADGLVIAATNCVVRGMWSINCRNGVVLRNTARGTVLGGTNSSMGNCLQNSVEAGVRIEGGSGHVLRGNNISGNHGVGVLVADGTNTSLEDNSIYQNQGAGIVVLGGTNHSLRANAIYENGSLGIDLGGDGVTANDDDDPDIGPNQLQNCPLISTAMYSASGLTVAGTLNSRPSRTYTLDFYANLVCDDSGSGEGQQHLGSASVTTGGSGNGNFNVTLTNRPIGRIVTATATDPAGNTSEFSPCRRFTSTVAPTTFTVTNVNDAGPGSLRQSILDSNARFANAPNTIAFNIPGIGVRRILLTSDVLPPITEPVIIDGYTQPGSSVNTASNAFNGVVLIRLDGILLGYGRALDITAGNSTVRGLNIMNFGGAAVACSGAGSNTISGNLIGLTVDGEVGPIGAGGEAVIPLSFSSGNLIGGTNYAARNVIPGGNYGSLWLVNSSSNRIAGNFLGCDTTGTNVVFGGGDGVHVDGDSLGNVIGGTNSAARNVLVGHYGSAIFLVCGGSVVQGNFIGVLADGSRAPEEYPGAIPVGLYLEGSNTLIGGTNAGAANVMVGYLYVQAGEGNAILRNSIQGANDVGIDLRGDGPTLNDPDDSDTGPNNLQNYPEILSAIRYPNRTVIGSRLQSIPNAAYRIDFYDNDHAPPFGYAEAQTWIGTTNVTLGASGQATFNWAPVASLPAGHWVTATATDAANNTSELAPAVIVALSNAVNLTVALSAPVGPVSRASNFTYSVEVRNLGPMNATGVVLSNLLPANVSFVSATATQGSCAHSAGVVTCSLGGLTAGGLAAVVLTVQPQTNGVAELTTRAFANEPEAYSVDNGAAGGPFVGIADIDVVAGGFLPESFTASQPFDTVITVTNHGPDSAFVRIQGSWDLPAVAISITTSNGTTPLSNATYFETSLGTLPPNATSTFAVRSFVGSYGIARIGVVVRGDAFDPDPWDGFYREPTFLPGAGSFSFENAVETAAESAGGTTLRVRRNYGAQGTVTVGYATTAGSANPGADYSPVSGTLTFAEGETEQSITVPVFDDFLVECGEAFAISLFNPTGGAFLDPYANTNCVVQILDDDPVLRGVVMGVSVTATNASATGDGSSQELSLSEDGRYVAFSSTAQNLVSVELVSPNDVYVRDLQTGTTTLASVNRFGTNGGDSYSYQPQLSSDGRYLAFGSYATDLVPNCNTWGCQQAYLRDLVSGTTRLVSISASGADGVLGVVEDLRITRGGLGVAFTSGAYDGSGIPDANGTGDVFFRDVATGVTHLVSVNRWGTASGNGASFLPPGGGNRVHSRYIAFTSYASDLAVGDNNGAGDVFVRDLTNAVTTLVSVNRFGTGSGNGVSWDPLVSADGRYVLFSSNASDLVPDDTNNQEDIFVRDLVARETRLVSVNRFGTGGGNGSSWHWGFSEDGRFALFASYATDLVTNEINGGENVFVRDLVGGTTVLVSLNCQGTGSGNGGSYYPSISPDGRYVAFVSDATDLVPGAGGSGHAYLRDLVTGTTTYLTPNWRLAVSSSGGCYNPVVASGATTVAFASSAEDLLPIDQNRGADVFAWHPLASNTVDLVVGQVNSPNPAGADCAVTYAITVVNRGLTNATGVVLTDTLPTGTTFVSATPSQGSCSHAAGVVTCPLGSINVDGAATVEIVAQLRVPGVGTNLASVTASEAEPLSANNISAESTVVYPRTLSISLVGGQVLITTWPCASADCVLEGATSLPPAGGWTPVSASVIDQGATRTLVVPIDSPLRFFRLRCP